jgi:ElaB/YqjD/DUF883 family membrane-anchored ribosome-binding protein
MQETPIQNSPPASSTPARDRLSQLDFEERWQASHRRHWFFDIVLTLLVLGLAGAAWYAFPIIKNHNTGLAKLPDIQKQVGTVEDGLKSAGSKFDEWTAGQQSLRDKSEQALRDLRSRMEAVETQAGEGASALIARVESEFVPQIEKLHGEYAELRSTRDADQERVASLEEQLKGVREQADKQAQDVARDLAAVRRDMDEQKALTQRQIADVTDLKQNQQRDRRDFDALNGKLATERVDFEVTKSRQSDIAPGVTLAITGIDIPYHRVNGWIWVLPDRRTIWIRGQSTQQPVEFYSTADNRKRELVITHLTDSSATGYLLQPKPAGIAAISPAGD